MNQIFSIVALIIIHCFHIDGVDHELLGEVLEGLYNYFQFFSSKRKV